MQKAERLSETTKYEAAGNTCTFVMPEKDVTAVEEKDYEHHLTWRGWLSFIVIALSFSGILKDMGPLSAFDFTVLTGKFGKIEGLTVDIFKPHNVGINIFKR